MKGIDIFCASQAATAICLSMEQPSSSSSPFSSSSTILLSATDGGGGRAIDRHNPIIKDSRRIISKSLPPCTSSSQPPISPKPQKVHHKKKIKNKKKEIPFKENKDKSLSKIEVHEKVENCYSNGGDAGLSTVSKSWRCTRPGEFISPPGSSRYLLRDKVSSFRALSSFDPVGKLSVEEVCDLKLPPSSSPSPQQVVVLRVSLHCRGCERKLRKHLSRMEGVTSFNIEFLAKKVTVTGNVTPVGVLSSISKVKNAQLWSPTVTSSTPTSDNLNNSESENDHKEAGA